MTNSDWSQFIPDLVIGIILAIFALALSAIIAYFRSKKFHNWLDKLFLGLGISKHLSLWKYRWHKYRLFFLISCLVIILEIIFYLVSSDWIKVGLSAISFLLGAYSFYATDRYRRLLSSRSELLSSRFETKFLSFPISSHIGNAYLNSRYLDPPSGEVSLGGATFQLKQDSLIFDTNENIRLYSLRDDGSRMVGLRLSKPINAISSVNFLINSGNSKSNYLHKKVGEIILSFDVAPPIVTELILGENIREWCVGNHGDLVRETTSPSINVVWKGMNKQGTSAIIDCLRIPVFPILQTACLEEIIIVHKPTQQPPDTLGVHFSIYAISIEYTQRVMAKP